MTTVKSVPSVSRFAAGNSCDSRTAAIAVGTSALTTSVGITPDATPVAANVALSRDEGRKCPLPEDAAEARSAHQDEEHQRQAERCNIDQHRSIVSRRVDAREGRAGDVSCL